MEVPTLYEITNLIDPAVYIHAGIVLQILAIMYLGSVYGFAL